MYGFFFDLEETAQVAAVLADSGFEADVAASGALVQGALARSFNEAVPVFGLPCAVYLQDSVGVFDCINQLRNPVSVNQVLLIQTAL